MNNDLLNRLASIDRDLLRPHLTPASLSPHQVVQAIGEPVRSAVFPESGLISVRASYGSRSMEATLVGREGLIGVEGLLGHQMSTYSSVVLLQGEALSIPVPVLRDALRASPDLHTALLSYVQALLRDIGETVVATSKCTVEQRVARWLCMAQDRTSGDVIALTHECVATTLGVRRPGVTVALHTLEGEHAIRSNRGRIIIRDRARLEAAAGLFYQVRPLSGLAALSIAP